MVFGGMTNIRSCSNGSTAHHNHVGILSSKKKCRFHGEQEKRIFLLLRVFFFSVNDRMLQQLQDLGQNMFILY